MSENEPVTVRRFDAIAAGQPQPAPCGHEHEYGGIAYRCERAPHPVDGHEERHRHAARIDAGYAEEIGDVDGDGTPDLLTWEGDEPGDGDNTEVAWGTVAAYGSAR
jgi:hypothetical protein